MIIFIQPEPEEEKEEFPVLESWERRLNRDPDDDTPPLVIVPPKTPDKLLAKETCMAALAELRHSKW